LVCNFFSKSAWANAAKELIRKISKNDFFIVYWALVIEKGSAATPIPRVLFALFDILKVKLPPSCNCLCKM
jgi:hypothetical protein